MKSSHGREVNFSGNISSEVANLGAVVINAVDRYTMQMDKLIVTLTMVQTQGVNCLLDRRGSRSRGQEIGNRTIESVAGIAHLGS